MRKKERSFLLVDGYNIVYAWDSLKELAEASLEEARNELIEILCDYRGYTDAEIIVVFDAHNVKGGVESLMRYNNISVVYTKEAETADHYIEKAVKSVISNYNVTVATSDNLEQVIILAEGAVRASARELYLRIAAAKEKMRKSYIQKKHIKENLLFDNLNAETAEFLERLRRK